MTEIIPHTRIPDAYMAQARTTTEIAIFYAIARRYDRKARSLRTAQETIGKDVFLGEQSIKNYFKDLEARGILIKTHKGNQFTTCNSYDVPLLRAYYDKIGLASSGKATLPQQQAQPQQAKETITASRGEAKILELWRENCNPKFRPNHSAILHVRKINASLGSDKNLLDFWNWFFGKYAPKLNTQPEYVQYVVPEIVDQWKENNGIDTDPVATPEAEPEQQEQAPEAPESTATAEHQQEQTPEPEATPEAVEASIRDAGLWLEMLTDLHRAGMDVSPEPSMSALLATQEPAYQRIISRYASMAETLGMIAKRPA